MKTKIHNGYISKLLNGEIKYNPFSYIASFFLMLIYSIFFWGYLTDSLSSNALILLSPVTFIGIIILVILVLSSGSDEGKTPVNIDHNEVLKKTDTLLDILPVKKESIITTTYFENTFVIIAILSFNIVGLLVLENDSGVIAIRGVVQLVTMLLCSIMTYKNIKNYKIVRKKELTQKRENKVLSAFLIIAFIGFFSMAEKAFNFIVSKNEALIASIYNSIIDSSILNFVGSFYVSFILIAISVTLAIYFNYYYRVGKKVDELATISNWREL